MGRRQGPWILAKCVFWVCLDHRADGAFGTSGEHRGRGILLAGGKSQGLGGAKTPLPVCLRALSRKDEQQRHRPDKFMGR